MATVDVDALAQALLAAIQGAVTGVGSNGGGKGGGEAGIQVGWRRREELDWRLLSGVAKYSWRGGGMARMEI